MLLCIPISLEVQELLSYFRVENIAFSHLIGSSKLFHYQADYKQCGKRQNKSTWFDKDIDTLM